MNNALRRFFGGPPVHVLVRLALMSLAVGVVLAALNIEPFDILLWIRDVFRRISEMGFEAVRRGGEYFLLGAVVVIPVWLIMRLFSMGKRTPKD